MQCVHFRTFYTESHQNIWNMKYIYSILELRDSCQQHELALDGVCWGTSSMIIAWRRLPAVGLPAAAPVDR